MAVTAEEMSRQHQLDAERAVIGAMLIDESIIRDALTAVDPRDFTNPANRLIFQAARSLFRAGEPADPITIRNQVGAQYSEYMAQLMEITPTSANWQAYAKAMREQAALQRIRELAGALMSAETLEDCRKPCADLTQELSAGAHADGWDMRQLLESFYESQDPEQAGTEYIRYGIDVIDQGSYTERGDVVVLGGYPSDGKTAMSLTLAYNMAGSYKVGYFSFETDKRKVRDRIMTHAMQVDFGKIKQRILDDGDWTAIAGKSADFAKRDLTVFRASGMTSTEIQAISQAYGFDVIFIDYVQLVKPELDGRSNRTEQMADVSRSLHTFAQTSGTLVIELAQLTRPERGTWREPDMQDLKESGQFEQDADTIMLMFRPKPESQYDREQYRIFKIAKNKEGRLGKWPMFFDGAKQTFSVVVDEDGHRATVRDYSEKGKWVR